MDAIALPASVAMSLPCHCHVIAMSLPWRRSDTSRFAVPSRPRWSVSLGPSSNGYGSSAVCWACVRDTDAALERLGLGGRRMRHCGCGYTVRWLRIHRHSIPQLRIHRQHSAVAPAWLRIHRHSIPQLRKGCPTAQTTANVLAGVDVGRDTKSAATIAAAWSVLRAVWRQAKTL